MKTTTKGLLVLFMISVILMGGYSFLSVKAQDSEGSLGKDVATTFRGIVKHHQRDIEDFILETKVSVAEPAAAKLDVIDDYINGTLRVKVAEIKEQREAVIAALDVGDLDDESFGMELKGLAIELALVAETMGEIGEKLFELGEGYEIADPLKARAEDLLDDLEECKEDATLVADAVLAALSSAEVPVAQEVIQALVGAELPVDEAVEKVLEHVPEEVPPEPPEVP